MAPRTPDELIAWLQAHPKKHAPGSPVGAQDGGPWATANASFCEMAQNNGGAFSQAFATASASREASGPMNSNRKTALKGEFHYFTNHIGMSTGGETMYCASTIFASNGTGLGLITVTEYLKHFSAQKYFGHTARHGTQTLSAAAPLPVGTGTNDMKLIFNKNGKDMAYYLASDTDIILTSKIGDRAVLQALYGAAVQLDNTQMKTLTATLSWNKQNAINIAKAGATTGGDTGPVLDAISAVPGLTATELSKRLTA